ncbi:glycine betaine ABC transporter substrate-binding protein [Glaciimonas immobilis]|uniref:Osmoprotectant transport system substrate-binding protein n=1 Tax=Glaciimonas immobilis TaxID=728004 RepID=A0A840RNN1_9BURK|nr:glycine betaine ABC transporter substrate-binding protein [Glaciimonas immobilis]KAF3998005.1 glycine betaine ABC transporter substrate-binding protein [Glaciimonas immobilis]MBB5199315.1 osmoprotectant transport system substrate-binding protein [Glaciimonas immobilis]
MKFLRLRHLLVLTLGLLSLALVTPAISATLVVGGKNFTEQLLLSSMTQQYLQSKGYDVALKNGLGSTIMRQAIESAQLDIVWEYTGSSLIVFNKINEKLDAEQSYARVKELDGAKGLVWLNASGLNNTYALAVPTKRAEEDGLKTIDDLAKKMASDKVKDPDGQHLFGVDFEFASRPDGLKPMSALYGMSFDRSEIKQMDPGLVYTALRNDQLYVGLTYASDGRIEGFNLTLLEDSRGFFPFYTAAPMVRKDVLDANPKLAEQLNALSAVIDTKKMAAMNKQVDIDQEPLAQVAADFLRAQGLM